MEGNLMKKPSLYSFEVDLAKEFGIYETLLIHHFQECLKVKNNLYIDSDHTWIRQTIAEISKNFPFFRTSTISCIIGRLISKNVIVRKRFYFKKLTTTFCYAFVDEKRFIPEERKI